MTPRARTCRLRIVPRWCAFAAFACAAPLAAQGELRNSSKECAICHVRWVEAFDRAGPAPKEPARMDDTHAGSEAMCLTCHDGSVVDSRFKVWSTRHHTTDQAPSGRVRIPTDRFPLDERGRMVCSTCHTAHAVPDDTDIRTVVFLREPNVDSSLCLACHPEHAQKNDAMHRLGAMDRPVPAPIIAAGGKAGASGNVIMCQTCHEPHGARNPWMLVLPPSELCIACHPNRDPAAAPPGGPPVHDIGRTYEGFAPPATLVAEKASFGPAGELTCLSCHRLHDASGARPLLIRGNEQSSLCLECHPRARAMIGSVHDLRVSAPEEVNAAGEKPSESGPCGSCHRIHGWAREAPGEEPRRGAGCIDCHGQGGPASTTRKYVEAHPVGSAPPEGAELALPLDDEDGKITCTTCHDPHAPRTNPSQGVFDGVESGAPLPGPRRIIAGMFLRRQGSALCAECHKERADALAGPHDPAAFPAELATALGAEPGAGACRVCHAAHNARGPYLWARTPAASDAGPVAGACGSCHGTPAVPKPGPTFHVAAALDQERVRMRHPRGAPRVKAEKIAADEERVDCAACHDPHAGSRARALLNSPGGDVCDACHEGKKGIRGTIHDPVEAAWGKERGVTVSHPCFGCHPIHGAHEKTTIWQAIGMTGADAGRCEGCHAPDGPGRAVAAPHVGAHPPAPPAASAAGALPLRDGAIKCATCHDIHAPAEEQKFLRGGRAEGRACIACHAGMAGMLGTAHDLVAAKDERPNVRGDCAAVAGPCSPCHVVHPPARGTAWGQPAPHGDIFGDARCTACHPENAFGGGHALLFVDRPVRQAFLRPPGIPWLDGAPPPHGEPSSAALRGGEIACLTCHDPHAAPPPRETKEMRPHGGAPERERRGFMRPEPESVACLRCHDRDIARASGAKLSNVKAEIAGARELHGPVREGECAACHGVHTAAEGLLAGNFPQALYSTFSVEEYEFCFTCHPADLAIAEKTESATNFRDGARNLHFVHVNKADKGRSCRFCHENHGSSLPRLLRSTVLFGPKQWPLKLGYEPTATGGLCGASCHRARGYDRRNPVGAAAPAPAAGAPEPGDR